MSIILFYDAKESSHKNVGNVVNSHISHIFKSLLFITGGKYNVC